MGFETFVLLWGQLQQNCNLPFQSLPWQVASILPLIIIKGWLSIYAFGPRGDQSIADFICQRDDCVFEVPVTNPITGHELVMALPMPVVVLMVASLIFLLINFFDFMV